MEEKVEEKGLEVLELEGGDTVRGGVDEGGGVCFFESDRSERRSKEPKSFLSL